MPSCVVKSCKNYMTKLKKSQGITYHKFPRSKNRRDDWVSIIRNSRGENNWNPSSASTVCSAHFDDVDFKTTAKGLRCLVPFAIPKRLLSNYPETQTHSTSTPILQISSNVRETDKYQQPTSSSMLQVPAITDEFKLSGYCRLCAISICDGMLVNVQSDNSMKNLIVKMSNRLNTNIDFSQKHLPTTICSICIKLLYTAYDFVVGIDLAQMTLNKISMQKDNSQRPVNLNQDNNSDLSNTSTQQTSIGSEACDLGNPWLHVSSEITSSQQLSPKIEAVSPPNSVELSQNSPFLLDTPRKCRLKDNLYKKSVIIDQQKKNLKRLNQKVRRLRNRNESLKNILKNLKDRNKGSYKKHLTHLEIEYIPTGNCSFGESGYPNLD
ncbi:hypothetical protein evm_007378 [Chilo suppressalis]|nr:hypothetical protein evm_007378 [Chilo suppressalis]